MDTLWLEQAVTGAPPGEEWLAEEERHTLARLTVPKRRCDWRLGRWTAKRAVAASLGLTQSPESLARIAIGAARSGAPRAVLDGRPLELAISISHSNGRGVCAVGRVAMIGCDIENIEPRRPTFLADYFDPREIELARSWPEDTQDAAFTLLWCAKESVLKAIECGLRSEGRAVSIERLDFAREGWQPFEASHRDGARFQGWREWADGFARTLVTLPSSDAPSCLRFE